MNNIKFYLVDESILPKSYLKAVKAQSLLVSGQARTVTEAVKIAGLSRAAYYKYKDKVFEYNPGHSDDIITLTLSLNDSKGVLSSVINEVYIVGANVLSINQQEPLYGVANVVISLRITDMTVSVQALINKLKSVANVKSVNLNNK